MKSSALARLPFLHGVPQATIAAVNRVLRPLSVTAGTVLFRTGDEGDACYLVETGALRVSTTLDGDVLATLGPGSFVGELAILLGEPRSATVTAVTDAELLVLTRADLDTLMSEHPSIGVALSRELGRRIVHANRRLTGEVGARRSVIWPAERVVDVAGGILSYNRRVAVAALRGAALGRTPARAIRVRPPLFGANDSRFDAVLLAAGEAPSPAALSAIADAEHVLAFGEAPPWLRAAAPPGRYVRLSDNDMGVRRAVRWATGRAVGLALSSGGSKTVAHLGVIRVLREIGVEIDAVAGTSGGAFGAVAVAFEHEDAYGLQFVEALRRATHWSRLDFNFPPRSGLFKGNRLHRLFDKWGDNASLEDAALPVWLVATDVANGNQVVLHEGPVGEALRSSMSIPGAMNPSRYDSRLLIDGAVVNPLPVDVLRDAGVGLVIASNVAGQATEIAVGAKLPSLLQIIGRMLNAMERQVINTQLPLADVVIRPRLKASGSFDFSNIEAMIAAGDVAARERVDDIKNLLAAASGHAVGASQ
jgi:predicted acylesterase/phospholipase RssA/CRP-like cAMP-binding protein